MRKTLCGIFIALPVVCGALAGLTACSSAPAVKDLPVENQKVEISDRLVYSNPDGFPNVVVWCDGNNRVFLTSREAQPIVVLPNNSECVK